MMKLLAILALAFGANATSDCLMCGGCFSMITHIISCVSDPLTECLYDPTSYTSAFSGRTYSEFYWYGYTGGEPCPMAYCGRTWDTTYTPACIDGELASVNCCDYVYPDIAGYTPASHVIREFASRAHDLSLLTRGSLHRPLVH